MIPLQNRFAVLGDQKQTWDRENTKTHMPLVNTNILDRTLTKIYFKLIQAIHHMDTVENSLHTGHFPTGMSRQVNKLTQFIKPSSPRDTTTEKIAQNTLTWMQKNMHILQEHYTQVIIQFMEQIQVFSNLEWTVAMKWAKNRYKHKWKESTLNFCKETIQNKQSILVNTTGPTSNATATQMASPPQAQVNRAPHDFTKTS